MSAEAVKAEVIPMQVAATGQAMTALTPMAMLDKALATGNVEIIAKVMDLQERWERNQARKAFDEAMAAAKAEIKTVAKNRAVDFTSPKGRTNYRYEDLAEIARTVDPALAKHGLSYRFRATSNPNEPITVTCIVSHRNGHSEENTLSAGRDESGNKNSIQGIGSTITYLQRYSLKAALGLAAGHDDDAKTVDTGEVITDAQAEEIRKLVTDSKSNADLFLKWAGAESIPDIRASKYQDAVKFLNAKMQKAKAS